MTRAVDASQKRWSIVFVLGVLLLAIGLRLSAYSEHLVRGLGTELVGRAQVNPTSAPAIVDILQTSHWSEILGSVAIVAGCSLLAAIAVHLVLRLDEMFAARRSAP